MISCKKNFFPLAEVLEMEVLYPILSRILRDHPKVWKNWILAVTPVQTGVQEIAKALKTLDSGFRRNDTKKNEIDFFTPSPSSAGNI